MERKVAARWVLFLRRLGILALAMMISIASALGEGLVTEENCLENSVFLGNSLLGAVKRGNHAPECDLFPGTGVNVKTALSRSADGRKYPMITELDDKQYERVFTMFGFNEMKWPNKDALIERYVTLLDAIRERQPEAKIYVISIIPITKWYEKESNIKMKTIRAMNEKLAVMCEEQGVHFLDVTDALVGENGYLVNEASTDGHHLRSGYSRHLVNEIRRQVTEWENSQTTEEKP